MSDQTPVIFISYADKDIDQVKWLKEKIEKTYGEDATVFASKYVNGGCGWRDKIEEAARSASVAILLCSPNALKSFWVMFEAGMFKGCGIPFVPLLFNRAKVNMIPSCILDVQAKFADDTDEVAEAFKTVEDSIRTKKEISAVEIRDYFVNVKNLTGSQILISNEGIDNILRKG